MSSGSSRGKSRSSGRKRPRESNAFNAEDVLEGVDSLAEIERAKAAKTGNSLLTLEDLDIDNVKKEVISMDEEGVKRGIEDTFIQIAKSILDERGLSFDVPSRSSGNQLYVPELDRIVLKDKTALREFGNARNTRKVAIQTRIMQLIYEICSKRIHVTKRDLFYTDVKLFSHQNESDDVLDDVSMHSWNFLCLTKYS